MLRLTAATTSCDDIVHLTNARTPRLVLSQTALWRKVCADIAIGTRATALAKIAAVAPAHPVWRAANAAGRADFAGETVAIGLAGATGCRAFPAHTVFGARATRFRTHLAADLLMKATGTFRFVTCIARETAMRTTGVVEIAASIDRARLGQFRRRAESALSRARATVLLVAGCIHTNAAAHRQATDAGANAATELTRFTSGTGGAVTILSAYLTGFSFDGCGVSTGNESQRGCHHGDQATRDVAARGRPGDLLDDVVELMSVHAKPPRLSSTSMSAAIGRNLFSSLCAGTCRSCFLFELPFPIVR